MTPEQKDELSLLAALGEADANQLRQIQSERTADPEFAKHHQQRCDDIASFRKAAEQGRSAEPLPELTDQSKAELDEVRRAAFAEAGEKQRNKIIRPVVWIAAMAACIGLCLFAAKSLFTADHPPILTLAPTGETGTKSPLIVWENAKEPDQKYDVWILPKDGSQKDAEALFVSKGVRSPLEFSRMKAARAGMELEPEKDYRILVCYAEEGRLAGTASAFSLSSDPVSGFAIPKTAAEAVLAITGHIENKRPSDALMMIEQLPEEIRQLTEVQTLKEVARKKIES